MTTTPQSMSDLPELPAASREVATLESSGDFMFRVIAPAAEDYYTANQMHEYGRLCRATAEQAGKVEGELTYDAAQEAFTAYFVKNYPGPTTIISDPRWHAPRLFRVAYRSFVGAAEAELHMRAKPTQPAAPDLPGMWEASDFTGGDPDERSHSERAATQMPVAWAAMDTRGQMIELFMTEKGANNWRDWEDDQDSTLKFDKAIPLYAAPVSPSREVEALADLWESLAALTLGRDDMSSATRKTLTMCASHLRAALAPVQEKAP